MAKINDLKLFRFNFMKYIVIVISWSACSTSEQQSPLYDGILP